MKNSPSGIDELERLRAENRALNEHVKQLVRAERRLTLSQQSLDQQLRNVEALNRFALATGHARHVEEIVRLATDFLISVFPYEQGLAFLRNDAGSFDLTCVSAVPGREPRQGQPNPLARGVTPGGNLRAEPWSGAQDRLEAAQPALREFIELFPAVFGAQVRLDGDASPAILALPIRVRGEDDFRALILVRRTTPRLSLLERLPDASDLPFVSLVGAHAAIAVENQLSLADAQEAIRARDEFLSIASHELKTPLTALILMIQSFARAVSPDEASARTFRAIERQYWRLARLVDQLLDVSQIRVGRLKPQFSSVDLSSVVRDVVATFEQESIRTGSTISLESPQGLHVWADRAQLQQVVTSLLSNAVKFGDHKPIEVRLESSEDRVTLEVTDHGIGIAEEDQRRIFDRFERAVSSKNFGGLGLGLYISRQIVEAHGGAIRVRSSRGQGATLTVELPVNGPGR